MKKSTLLLVSLIAFQIANGQLFISLSMNPRPVANISNWSARKDVLTLTVSPSPVLVPIVKINTTIKTTDGTTVAVTDFSRATPRSLNQGGLTIFYAGDVVNLESMVFSGSYQSKMNRTGQLPPGNYQIIVHLDSADGPVPRIASIEQTRTFFLSATQLPVLMMPADGAKLKAEAAQTAITFRWTPVSPKPTENVRYHVQVFEVLDYQTPMQALRSNMPLLDKEVLGATQYIWQPQLSFIDSTHKKFIWTIQSFDYQGQIITGETANGEGRSEARIFIIDGMKNKRPEKESGKREPD
jgi:hypothetical protein